MSDIAEHFRPRPDAPPPIPAATLVVFRRAGDGGSPELLMVERSKAMRFAGGAAVFPGGRIDPGDHALALEYPGADKDDLAHRIGAIRETLEETGLVIGLTKPISAADARAARDALVSGEPFGAMLARFDWQLDLSALVPFARWCPRHSEVRMFDTRFYLADTGTGAVEITADETENRHLFWASAAETLRRAEAGALSVIFPTARNLGRLAPFASFAEAQAQAEAIPVRVISPHHETRDGVDHLCIPGGLGYPVTSQAMAKVRRG